MKFLSAGSLEEALAYLDSFGKSSSILAGGTDLMIQLQRAEISPKVLIHIEGIPDLAFVRKNDGIKIGALTSHRQLALAAELDPDYSALSSAARLVGGWQTQEVGTIGGNLCNASPAADLAPPLLVHGATVALASAARGERVLPLSDFLKGRRATARKSDEMLTHINLEAVPPGTADLYCKVGRRSAMEVAIVGLAVRLTMEEDGETVNKVRLATCSVGPIPCRDLETEAFLKNRLLNDETLQQASEILAANVSPIDDVRGSAAYRSSVLKRVCKHALKTCADKITLASE